MMSAPMFYVLNPLGAFQSWFNALSIYQLNDANLPGYKEFFGIRSMLAAAGVPLIDLTIVGIVFALVIWFFRSRLTDVETLALLVIAGLLTGHGRTFALIGLIVTVPVLCTHADQRRWVVPAGLWLGVFMMVPRRFHRELVLPDVFLHWRVIVVLALALVIIVLVVLRERDRTISKTADIEDKVTPELGSAKIA
jgi:hypothetical protein